MRGGGAERVLPQDFFNCSYYSLLIILIIPVHIDYLNYSELFSIILIILVYINDSNYFNYSQLFAFIPNYSNFLLFHLFQIRSIIPITYI